MNPCQQLPELAFPPLSSLSLFRYQHTAIFISISCSSVLLVCFFHLLRTQISRPTADERGAKALPPLCDQPDNGVRQQIRGGERTGINLGQLSLLFPGGADTVPAPFIIFYYNVRHYCKP